VKTKISEFPIGFTLLEVLIAVLILGLTVTIILQHYSTALKAAFVDRKVTLAVLHAKEKLEELKVRKEFNEFHESGSFDDGYEWEVNIVPYKYEDEEENEDFYERLPFETYKLEAVVKWQDGKKRRKIKLSTLKTVRKKQWR